MKKKKIAVAKHAGLSAAGLKAVKQQDHNRKVWLDVIAGKKPKSALKNTAEGGECEGLVQSVEAHAKLFPQSAARQAPTKVPTKVRSTAELEGKYIHILVGSCPRKAGTAAAKLWELYKEGMSTEAYFEAGGAKGSLKCDIERGNVELRSTK